MTVPTASLTGTRICARCGNPIADGQARTCLNQVVCDHCWDELLRLDILTWLPVGTPAGGEDGAL